MIRNLGYIKLPLSHYVHWYYLNCNIYQFQFRSSLLILEFSRKQNQPYHRDSILQRRSNNRAAILPLERTYSPVTLTTVMCGPFMLEGHNFTRPLYCADTNFPFQKSLPRSYRMRILKGRNSVHNRQFPLSNVGATIGLPMLENLNA